MFDVGYGVGMPMGGDEFVDPVPQFLR